ncbi:helix-turn-helix domain-containing protein [Alkalicoccobacillus gibsonii]|uniref:helix-turn-helix domain-containing protein n=1 Tax=Alkalicoccobacillus gibsonii TaxID=79881 RepID=UPI003F7BDCD6
MKLRHNLRVQMARKKVGSITELSRLTGLDYTKLIKFNNYSQRRLDPEMIVLLCEFFGCKLENFIFIYEGSDGTDDGFPKQSKCS